MKSGYFRRIQLLKVNQWGNDNNKNDVYQAYEKNYHEFEGASYRLFPNQ